MYGFVAGILLVIAAFIFGNIKGSKETKTKIGGQVVIEKTEKEMVKDTVPVVTEVVKEQTQAEVEYKAATDAIEKASQANDTDWLKKIASDLAKKALEKGATEK